MNVTSTVSAFKTSLIETIFCPRKCIQPKLTMSKVWFYLYGSLLKVKLSYPPAFLLLPCLNKEHSLIVSIIIKSFISFEQILTLKPYRLLSQKYFQTYSDKFK